MSQLNRVYPAVMASAATLTGAITLSKAYEKIFLEIPAISGCIKYIQAANSAAASYRRILVFANSASTQTNAFAISSAATNCMVEIPGGFSFYKVETDIAVADGSTFNLICVDRP